MHYLTTAARRQARQLVLAGACLLALASLPACGINKGFVAAGLPDPDRAFQTGTTHGYDVYIWDCYKGKKIVVFRTSAELVAGNYARQEGECGALTPIEQQLVKQDRHPRDPKGFWGH